MNGNRISSRQVVRPLGLLILACAFWFLFADRTAAEKIVAGQVSAKARPEPTPGPSMPIREQNLDANGLIRVHEQGVADVNVTNTPLPVDITNSTLEVTGTVSVDNFPSQQDVFVTGGTWEPIVTLKRVQRLESFSLIADPGEADSMTFSQIDATNVFISSGTFDNDEVSVRVEGPLGLVYRIDDRAGDSFTFAQALTHPIPIHQVSMVCHNESSSCNLAVSIAGF